MTVLPQLEHELLDAHARRSPAGGHRQTPGGVVRGVLPALAAVLVTAAVVGVALTLRGGGPGIHPSPGGQPPRGSSPPALPRREQRLLNLAMGETIAHDRACAFRPPRMTVSNGAPPADILNRFAVLRPSRATPLPTSRLQGPDGGRPYLGIVYQRHIRLARTQHVPPVGRIAGQTERYYLVPSDNVVGARIPARCYAEERAALMRRLRGATGAFPSRVLDAQFRAWTAQSALQRHPEGIDVQIVSGRFVPDEFGGTLSQIDAGSAITNEGPAATHPLRDRISGLVPDGVASVSLVLPRGRLGRPGARPATVSVPVVNNIFIAAVPNGRGFPTLFVWRNANGRPIKVVPAP